MPDQRKGTGQGGEEKPDREEERDGGPGGGQVQKRELTWTSSEKPVWTEPCRMQLRVVPTYSVSPRPSATVRTGPKSSGTWAGKRGEGRTHREWGWE